MWSDYFTLCDDAETVIRKLTEMDLADALTLSESAGWNQDTADWQRLLRLSSCFGVEEAGRIVSSVSVTCYGTDLAWIGMVLTLPEHRGQGHASRLMKTAMDHALGRDMTCIKLDATDLGAPVYRKFGFTDECIVERWRSTSAKGTADSVTGSAGIDWQLDREAFGADRRALIEAFPEWRVEADAFAARRPSHFGPCIARTPESAALLAQWGTASRGPAFWDLFPGNWQAQQLAHATRFVPARKLLRMSYQGRDLDQNPALVYALAGFEWG